MKKYVLVLILFLTNQLWSENTARWDQISGTWSIRQSHLTETRGWANRWRYYELMNNNTILLTSPFYSITDYSFQVRLDRGNCKLTPLFMAVFGSLSPESAPGWTYRFFAMQLGGDEKGIRYVRLVYSDRLDLAAPTNIKDNYYVKELAGVDYPLPYGETRTFAISIRGRDVTITADGMEILRTTVPESYGWFDGRMGFSSSNCLPSIDSVMIKSGENILFQDNFDSGSIKAPTVRARIERTE